MTVTNQLSNQPTNKIRSKRSFQLITIVIFMGLLAGCFGRGGHNQNMMFDAIAYKLDFNEQQKAIVDRIKQEVKAIRAEHRNQHQNLFSEAATLINQERLDTSRIEQIATTHQNKRQQYFDRILPMVAELHATLSPEQKEKLTKFINKKAEKHQRRHNHSHDE